MSCLCWVEARLVVSDLGEGSVVVNMPRLVVLAPSLVVWVVLGWGRDHFALSTSIDWLVAPVVNVQSSFWFVIDLSVWYDP